MKAKQGRRRGLRTCIYLIHFTVDQRITHASAFLPVHDNLYIVPQSLNFSIVVHERYKNKIRFSVLNNHAPLEI